MSRLGVDHSLLRNPLVVLGSVTILGTGVAFVVASAPFVAVVVQSTLPLAVGLGLVGYGWWVNEELSLLSWRTMATWIGLGLVAFFAMGFWFGTVSRLFETSFSLAVFGSLATGAALGCTIGVYAARLQRANAQLADRNERLSDFASIVSHDLRNPLSVAKARLELVDDDEHVPVAQQSLDRIGTIIDEMLTLTREAEGVTEMEPVQLDSVARQAWQTVDTGEATLSVPESTELYANPDLLAELLENLFRNAVEHAGQDVTITVSTCEAGFYVADDGPGIPLEDRENIFEPGYSTDEGTGLGLMIVARIAESHDWSVSLDPDRAEGTCFLVAT
jgi:signal transduction histidine kinase